MITGSLSKKSYPKDQAFRKVNMPVQLLILHLVVDKPGILLHEIKEELSSVLMVEIDISTICRFLHDCGFTRQKLRHVALQQDQFLRQKFIVDVSLYDPEQLIFIDETGFDRRNLQRKYGYSIACVESL